MNLLAGGLNLAGERQTDTQRETDTQRVSLLLLLVFYWCGLLVRQWGHKPKNLLAGGLILAGIDRQTDKHHFVCCCLWAIGKALGLSANGPLLAVGLNTACLWFSFFKTYALWTLSTEAACNQQN